MKIDRQRFLSLVLGMASPLVGCGGGRPYEPAPARPSASVSVVVPGDAQCVDWSPSGACLAYGRPPDPVMQPTAEYAPTGECYGWDQNGTCTEWVPDYVAPVSECIQYDPTGECVAWS